MAGFYPDVPAPRMAYDSDGTTMIDLDTSWQNGVELSLAQRQTMNSEAGGLLDRSNLALIFPQLRDLRGLWWTYNGGSSTTTFHWSNNTTNGTDGAWNLIGNYSVRANTKASQRDSIQAISINGAKGLRANTNWTGGGEPDWGGLHVYGTIVSAETPDRLRIWHPTLDEPLDDPTSSDGAYLDWGDVPRSSTQDRTFRVKNNSPTFTANTINITNQALTDTTPSVPPQFTFSNGGAFSTSLGIGNLAPGAISSVITVRRTTPSNAVLSLWTARIVATPGSMT